MELIEPENMLKENDEMETTEESEGAGTGGLATVTTSREALQELRWHAQNENNVIAGSSEGSVRDYRKQGTWT